MKKQIVLSIIFVLALLATGCSAYEESRADSGNSNSEVGMTETNETDGKEVSLEIAYVGVDYLEIIVHNGSRFPLHFGSNLVAILERFENNEWIRVNPESSFLPLTALPPAEMDTFKAMLHSTSELLSGTYRIHVEMWHYSLDYDGFTEILEFEMKAPND